MQDRLTEFMAGVKQSGMSPTPKKVMLTDAQGNIPRGDVELGFIKRKKDVTMSEVTIVSDLEGFNAEAESIRGSFASLRANIDRIQALYIKTIGSTDNDKASKTSAELDSLLVGTNGIAKGIKSRLDVMRTTTATLHGNGALQPADLQIRANQHSVLMQNFQNLIQEYQTLQTNYKSKYEEKMRRQYLIARPEATEDELNKAINEEDSSRVFVQEVQGQPQAAQDAAQYVRERHRDIVRLDKSIRELNQLFVDMTILVDNQGQLLDHIEINVGAAEAYVQQGNVALEGALRRKRRHRKLKIALAVFLLILAGIITAAIVTAVK